MKEVWKKHKLFITSLAYVLVIFLLVYFAAVPWIASIRGKTDKIQEKIIDNELEKEKLAMIPEMENTYEDFQKNKNFLSVFLDTDNEVNFIKYLEATAHETGNIIELKIEEAADPKAAEIARRKSESKKEEEKNIEEKLSYPDYLLMEINLKGGYRNLVDFIHKIENAEYYVNILSLDLKKETEDSRTVNRSGDVIFFAGQNEEKPEENLPEERLSSALRVVVYISQKK